MKNGVVPCTSVNMFISWTLLLGDMPHGHMTVIPQRCILTESRNNPRTTSSDPLTDVSLKRSIDIVTYPVMLLGLVLCFISLLKICIN